MTLSLSYYHARREDMWRCMRDHLKSEFVHLQPEENSDASLEEIFASQSLVLSQCYKSIERVSLSPEYSLSGVCILEFNTPNLDPELFFTKDHSRKSKVSLLFSALEFYVNLELTFCKLKSLVREADSRHRGDVSWNYINYLIEVCKFNEYEKC
jgi:hypothetical protein